MSEHGVRVIQMYVGADEPAIGQCLCGRVFALNSGRSLTRASNPRTAGTLDLISRWVVTGHYKDGTITMTPFTLPNHFETRADDHLTQGDVDLTLHEQLSARPTPASPEEPAE